MKKLGLIGGVGPESTILYYKGILKGVMERAGPPPSSTDHRKSQLL